MSKSGPTFSQLLLLILALFAGPVASYAQVQPNIDSGMHAFGSFHSGDVDMVSLSNGNVMFKIPLVSYPQRGGKLGVEYFFADNAKKWQVALHETASSNGGVNSTYYWNPTNVNTGDSYGVSSSLTVQVRRIRTVSVDPASGIQVEGDFDYRVILPDGSTHLLFGPLDNAGTLFRSYDTSGFQFILTPGVRPDHRDDMGMLVDRNGTQYVYSAISTSTGSTAFNSIFLVGHNKGEGSEPRTVTTFKDVAFPSKIVDANGNFIVYGNGAPTVDTMGRTLSASLSVPVPVATSDFSHCVLPNRTISGAVIYNFPGPNGGTTPVKLCVASTSIGTSFSQSNVLQFPNLWADSLQGPAPSSIVLPDGSSWSIDFDAYGNVISIIYPTGGSVSYTWQEVSLNSCNDGAEVSRAVHTRTVTDGKGNSAVWQYTWGQPQSDGSLTNIVTDPKGNDSAHVMRPQQAPCAYYETQTRYYQGNSTSGKLLKTVDTVYTAVQGANDNGAAMAANVVPIAITTTLANGKVSQVNRQYDFSADSTAFGGITFGDVVVEKVSDYGQGSPGATLREKDTTYVWQNDARYLTAHLLDLPASIVIKDGSQNRMAETDYVYDESQYLTASSITTQHTSPPSAVRGNPTTISHWLKPGNSMISSHTNWYDSGEVYQQIDPLGNTTTHSYDPAYAGAYSTKTQDALGHFVSGTYDFNTGLLTSFTNTNATSQANGNTPGDSAHTTNYAYDSMGRMTSATLPVDPLGNQPQTTFNYPDATTVERLHKITASLTDDAFTYTDGLGRNIRSKHVTPDGNALVDTTYDALGQPASVTNPYFYTSELTYGLTQNQYDALGRVTQITKQDGGISTVSYSDNCTTTKDEAGKLRQACSDALGRLIEVDEPGVMAGHTLNNSLAMQNDGSLVVYSPSNQPLWSTGTAGSNATGFEMQDDGNLVLYTFRWAAGIYVWPPPPGPFPPADCGIGINLNAPQTLPSGKCITSPHRQYLLYMPPDGNLFIYDVAHNVGTWGAGTGGHPGAYAVMQTDGNFVVYSADGQTALWNSGTNGTNAERLEMSDDGRVIIYRSAWNSGTSQGISTQMLAHPGCDLGTGMGQGGWLGAGQCFVSYNGRYQLLMQTDGNLVINDLGVSPAQTLWSSNTGLTPLSPGIALQTLYTYDALGNLTCVEQHGDSPSGPHPDGTAGTGCSADPSNDANSTWRVRRFTYDSFSRLLTAKNPESGTLSYFYDANGNLLQKVMPAPNQTGTTTHTISYCYDALNRVTGKAYSWQNCQNGQLPPGTTVVSYTYDDMQVPNSIGHLTKVIDQAGSASYSYDILGRMSGEQRTIAGVTKNMGYTYNLDSSVATVTYPSGATITYTPDSAGRVLKAVDSANNINYVTGATYGPTNALTGSVYGQSGSFSGIVNSFSYNNRLQPTTLWSSSPTRTLMYLVYDFHLGNSNNGNVWGITNNRDITRSQSFTYDALNRLISAQNAGTDCSQKLPDNHTEYWGNTYGYDAWGNLLGKTPTKCSAENLSVTAAVNNQLHGGYAYDAAGNMMHDNIGTNYTYDLENRITGAVGLIYTYDADGNRVEKSDGGNPPSGTLYWYMSLGIVGESDLTGNLQSEYVFFDGERVARRDFPGNTVSYYFSDHLKTASVVTDAVGTIKAESDYYPWGGELQFTNNDSNHYKFTGKERDTETGLDYFGARHYSNALGRFITPDWAVKATAVPYADFGNPQSLNLYGYVGGNPASKADPDGHACCDVADNFNRFVDRMLNAMGREEVRQVSNYVSDVAVGSAKGGINFFIEWGNGNRNIFNKLGGHYKMNEKLKPSNNTQANFMQVGGAVAMSLVTRGRGKAEALPNDALVVRGGVPTPGQLTKGAESVAADGTLSGVSVQSAKGATVEQLSQGIPNNQVGVTTVGAVRNAGGDVVPTGTTNNPCHCDMNGVTPEQGSTLFQVQPNPSKLKQPQ